MRTFDLTCGIDIRAVVPEQFTQGWRTAAKADDASEFLKRTQEQFPDDDEGFTLHILKHGMRRCIRAELLKLFEQSGIGGTLAPASVISRDRSPPTGKEPALASEIAQVIPG